MNTSSIPPRVLESLNSQHVSSSIALTITDFCMFLQLLSASSFQRFATFQSIIHNKNLTGIGQGKKQAQNSLALLIKQQSLFLCLQHLDMTMLTCSGQQDTNQQNKNKGFQSLHTSVLVLSCCQGSLSHHGNKLGIAYWMLRNDWWREIPATLPKVPMI